MTNPSYRRVRQAVRAAVMAHVVENPNPVLSPKLAETLSSLAKKELFEIERNRYSGPFEYLSLDQLAAIDACVAQFMFMGPFPDWFHHDDCESP